MTDTTRLLEGLRAYAAALELQLAHLRDDGDRLQSAWSAARAVYSGHGADVFAEAFERARASADAYAHAAERVVPLLHARIAALEAHEAGSPGDL